MVLRHPDNVSMRSVVLSSDNSGFKKKALDGSFSFSLTVKLFDEIVLMNSNIFLLLGITFQLRQSLCINFVSYRVKPSSNNRITLLDKAGSMMLMSHVIHSE